MRINYIDGGLFSVVFSVWGINSLILSELSVVIGLLLRVAVEWISRVAIGSFGSEEEAMTCGTAFMRIPPGLPLWRWLEIPKNVISYINEQNSNYTNAQRCNLKPLTCRVPKCP
jgi:hypothetical protein